MHIVVCVLTAALLGIVGVPKPSAGTHSRVPAPPSSASKMPTQEWWRLFGHLPTGEWRRLDFSVSLFRFSLRRKGDARPDNACGC